MKDKKVIDLHHSHIKSAIERLQELQAEEGLCTLSITCVTKSGDLANLFAHDGNPQPHMLLGGLEETRYELLKWMEDD